MSDDKNDERKPTEVEIRGGDRPSDYIPHELPAALPYSEDLDDEPEDDEA